jgi:chromosome segregation ATPase
MEARASGEAERYKGLYEALREQLRQSEQLRGEAELDDTRTKVAHDQSVRTLNEQIASLNERLSATDKELQDTLNERERLSQALTERDTDLRRVSEECNSLHT